MTEASVQLTAQGACIDDTTVLCVARKHCGRGAFCAKGQTELWIESECYGVLENL